jgi:hypothetical protein
MNKRYERYIDYIVSDIEAPYFENMVDNYGLSPNEYPLVFSKLFNQPVTVKGDYVYNEQGNKVYSENSNGSWWKKEYDNQGNEIYYEGSNGNGYWWKQEYDSKGNLIYYEDSDGYIEDIR